MLGDGSRFPAPILRDIIDLPKGSISRLNRRERIETAIPPAFRQRTYRISRLNRRERIETAACTAGTWLFGVSPGLIAESGLKLCFDQRRGKPAEALDRDHHEATHKPPLATLLTLTLTGCGSIIATAKKDFSVQTSDPATYATTRCTLQNQSGHWTVNPGAVAPSIAIGMTRRSPARTRRRPARRPSASRVRGVAVLRQCRPLGVLRPAWLGH